MTQASTPPSLDACAALLHEIPAITAFRRAMHRVTPEHARAWIAPLSVLSRAPAGLRVVDVAEALHVDLSVASRHVAQLEERGLVRREPDPRDGRAQLVRPTAQGERWLEEVRRRFAARVQRYLAGWDEADVVALTELLRRFGASMEAAGRRDEHAVPLTGLAPAPPQRRARRRPAGGDGGR